MHIFLINNAIKTCFEYDKYGYNPHKKDDRFDSSRWQCHYKRESEAIR